MFKTTRRKLFSLLMEKQPESWDVRYKHTLDSVAKSFPPTINSTDEKQIEKIVRKQLSALKKRWEDSNRTEKIFLAKNEEWLDGIVTVSYSLPNSSTKSSQASAGEMRVVNSLMQFCQHYLAATVFYGNHFCLFLIQYFREGGSSGVTNNNNDIKLIIKKLRGPVSPHLDILRSFNGPKGCHRLAEGINMAVYSVPVVLKD